MIQPVLVNVFLNRFHFRKLELNLCLKLEVVREILQLQPNQRFISKYYGLISPAQEETMMAFQIENIRTIYVEDIDQFLALSPEESEEPDDSESEIGYYDELENSSQFKEDSSSSYANSESSSYIEKEKPKKSKKSPKNHKAEEGKKARGRKPKQFKNSKSKINNNGALNEEELDSTTNNTNNHNNIQSLRALSSYDIAVWYSNPESRITGVSYEIDRTRFHSIRLGSDSRRRKVSLIINGILGKLNSSRLAELYNIIMGYFEPEFVESQTRYLYYVDGEFVISQVKL
jgi:hypothetical protein